MHPNPLTPDPNLAPDLAAEIGANLRHTRQRRGLNQRTLSARAGISSAHLSQIERGLAVPSLLAAIRLTRVLGIPVTALWDAPNPPHPDQGARDGRITDALIHLVRTLGIPATALTDNPEPNSPRTDRSAPNSRAANH